MTLREYILFWQETYDKHQSRPTTYAAHNYVFKNHILPSLGDIPLSELTSEMVGEFLEERRRFGNHRPGSSGLGEETMRHIHRLLQQCLDQAMRDGLIGDNPARAFHYSKPKKVNADVLTPLEMEDYLDAAERLGHLPMFMLALTAGLRQGELIALKWNDLNVKNRTLTISEQRSVERRELIEYGSETRTITLASEMVDLLIMEHTKHPNSPLMFMHPATQRPYSPQMVRRMHNEIIREAGLDRIRFTDLRHTCAVLSLRNGMSPEKITSADMGYIFEELIRKFSESYDEQAGAHFTSRDIIYLMTELLVAPEKAEIMEEGCTKTAYDMAMGTSQMLGCLTERLQAISEDAALTCFGQEFNPETYAIAKADMLIKGGNASGMKYGDTLSDDAFTGYEFDYIISNPPFGIDWKREKTQVEAEAKKGFDGRFGPGLPAISDGQMLFMLNGVKKLKPGSGRMAIIQNGSSLFTGDAGSGASEIRRCVIEGDLVEAIIQLPTDLFYNTGISTYIWVLTKGKAMHRSGKVQLIDASKCFVKRRKNIGSKRVDLDDACIELIIQAYEGFANKTYEENGLTVESKVFDKEFFGFTKVTVETAQADENGKPILKKGKRQPVKGASDTEIIPLSEDIDAYIKKNVLPYNPLAYIDPAKDKTGYEVPFTRLFYKFTQPTPSAEIFEEIKALEDEETILMKELFGNA